MSTTVDRTEEYRILEQINHVRNTVLASTPPMSGHDADVSSFQHNYRFCHACCRMERVGCGRFVVLHDMEPTGNGTWLCRTCWTVMQVTNAERMLAITALALSIGERDETQAFELAENIYWQDRAGEDLAAD